MASNACIASITFHERAHLLYWARVRRGTRRMIGKECQLPVCGTVSTHIPPPTMRPKNDIRAVISCRQLSNVLCPSHSLAARALYKYPTSAQFISLFTQTQKISITNMTTPNVDKPNEGILNSLANSATNAVNYVSESIQGTVCLS